MAFYINLDRRTDRRAEIEKELADNGIVAERFPAIEHASGIIGCGLSHIAVLKLARERGYKSVMIFEDDFMFLDTDTSWKTKIPASYDIVMLAYGEDMPSLIHDDTFNRVRAVRSTSGYIVHSRFYDTLIAHWEDGVRMLTETGLHWIYALDKYWNELAPFCEWYLFRNKIGKQRPSFSDLANSFVEYDC
jgi:GR25 family glycosyltransferase involved in LPS biosynthesis